MIAALPVSSLKRLYAALGTDGQHMASALAQRRINAGTEGFQQVEGDKGLNRSGEAAAVYAYRAAAIKQFLTKGYSESHALMLPAA